MKLNFGPSHSASAQGSSVIVMLALLAIMVSLVMANIKTVNWLRAQVKLVNQREIARLAASATNQPAGAAAPGQPATNP